MLHIEHIVFIESLRKFYVWLNGEYVNCESCTYNRYTLVYRFHAGCVCCQPRRWVKKIMCSDMYSSVSNGNVFIVRAQYSTIVDVFFFSECCAIHISIFDTHTLQYFRCFIEWLVAIIHKKNKVLDRTKLQSQTLFFSTKTIVRKLQTVWMQSYLKSDDFVPFFVCSSPNIQFKFLIDLVYNGKN